MTDSAHGKAAGFLTLMVACTCSLASHQYVHAQDAAPVTVGIDLDFRSRYLFAGIPFAEGEVIQPAIAVGYGGWTFNAFTSYDLTSDEISEGDVWADYYHQLNESVGAFLGAAVYNFKIGDWEATPELYAGLVLSLPGTPTLYVAHDFHLTTADHYNLSLSHTVTAGDVSIVAAGSIEYNNRYYRADSNFAYADATISAAVPVGRLSLTPMVRLLGGLADDIESRVVGGIGVHWDLGG